MTQTESDSGPAALKLERPEGPPIAYHKTAGRSPTVVFLTGLRSDMTGGKALALEAFCRARGQAFLRFDYRGHGESGGTFEEGTVGLWRDDALAAIDALTEGPLVLVGSSLGGWIMLLVATARAARIEGLVGIAPAPDFTEDLMWEKFSPTVRERLARDGVIYIPSLYSPELTPVTHDLIEDGRHHLLLRSIIPFQGPVRLIHGLEDPDVPWQTSLRIAEHIASHDVEITLVKGAGHRLSEPEDLERLCATVAALSGELA